MLGTDHCSVDRWQVEEKQISQHWHRQESNSYALALQASTQTPHMFITSILHSLVLSDLLDKATFCAFLTPLSAASFVTDRSMTHKPNSKYSL